MFKQLLFTLNQSVPRYGVVWLTVPRSVDRQAKNDCIRNVGLQIKAKPRAL